MPVVRKLQNIGGSRGVILPRAFLDQLALEDDSQVEISLKGDEIWITAHRPEDAKRGRPRKPAKG